LIPKSTSEFFKEYFANSAETLKNEVEEAEKGDIVF